MDNYGKLFKSLFKFIKIEYKIALLSKDYFFIYTTIKNMAKTSFVKFSRFSHDFIVFILVIARRGQTRVRLRSDP